MSRSLIISEFLFVFMMLVRICSCLEKDSGCNNEQILSESSPQNQTAISLSGLKITHGWNVLISHPGYSSGDGGAIMTGNTCSWTILPVADKYIVIRLLDMSNLLCHSSLTFFITVDDDNKQAGWNACSERDKTDPLGGTPMHIGGQVGKPVTIRYNPPAETTRRHRGFMLEYTFKAGGCRGEQLLGADENGDVVTRGALYSHPGAGAWAVEARLKCIWHIVAPKHKFIVLTATNIWIHCVNDWLVLSVFDAPFTDKSKRLAKVKCTNKMAPMTSSGSHMTVKYTDSWASNGLGFRFDYEIVDRRSSGCGGEYLRTELAGSLLSHATWQDNDDEPYLPFSRCKWLIQLPQQHTIALTFPHYDVLGGCEAEYLTLSDPSTGAELYKFCGFHWPPPGIINISSHQLQVEFFTSQMVLYSNRGRGFQMHYISQQELESPEPGAFSPYGYMLLVLLGVLATIWTIMCVPRIYRCAILVAIGVVVMLCVYLVL